MKSRDKGGKFLKKLWCCVGGEYYKIREIRDSKADVSSVSPSSERIKELWVVCGLYAERWSYAIGWYMVT